MRVTLRLSLFINGRFDIFPFVSLRFMASAIDFY